jgi:hypothetical protein
MMTAVTHWKCLAGSQGSNPDRRVQRVLPALFLSVLRCAVQLLSVREEKTYSATRFSLILIRFPRHPGFRMHSAKQLLTSVCDALQL